MKHSNVILKGNNLDYLSKMDADSVDLVYLDPPFNKGRTFTGKNGEFEDKWKTTNEYLEFIREVLIESQRILKKTGSIYLHCDNSISHQLQLLMGIIFGENQYKNEIIWVRNNGRTQRNKYEPRNYGIANDIILFFTKSNNHTFNLSATNRQHTETELARFNHKDDKGIYGRFPPYRPLSLGRVNSLVYEFKGITPPEDTAGWLGTKEFMEEQDKQGNLELVDGVLFFKRRPSEGVPVTNVWTDIKRVKGDEKTDYPTQKPLALLERIIKVSSNEGDLVLDPFCGSGTTLVAARNLGRKYIGIDNNVEAYEIAKNRLAGGGLC